MKFVLLLAFCKSYKKKELVNIPLVPTEMHRIAPSCTELHRVAEPHYSYSYIVTLPKYYSI